GGGEGGGRVGGVGKERGSCPVDEGRGGHQGGGKESGEEALSEPHDPHRPVEVPSVPADALDAGRAASFGPPRSSLGDLRPVRLQEAEGESDHVVRPPSDALPPPGQTGDCYQLSGEVARGGLGAVLRRRRRRGNTCSAPPPRRAGRCGAGGRVRRTRPEASWRTGSGTTTWPASATRRHWRNRQRKNARRARSSGPR